MCWKMQCHSSCSFVIFLLNQDKVIYHQKIYLRENDFSFLKIYEISIACMYALLPMQYLCWVLDFVYLIVNFSNETKS